MVTKVVSKAMQLVIGTYTRGFASEGIYRLDVGADGGEATLSLAAKLENPSWQVRHPRLPVLYSVVETRGEENEGGAIVAFRVNDDGALSMVARVPSMGGDPCHLSVAGDFLLASNYDAGNLAVWRLDDNGVPVSLENLVQHNGSSVDPVRQKSPHVHSTCVHAESGTALVCDLGVDRVYRYALSEQGIDVLSRKTISMRPGAGPRLGCSDPSARYFYVINELDNTIVSFDLAVGERAVELATTSTLPDDCDEASYCAHLTMTGDGRHLYASNRGHDSIAVFEVLDNGELGLLQTVSSGGQHPRFFMLMPGEEYLWVANRDSDNIVVMARDPESGKLTATGTEISVPAPVCLTILG